MKRPFEDFAAWCLAPTQATPAAGRPEREHDAWQRWDGEGGNTGMPAARRKLIRANALARIRGAARLFRI